MKDINQHLARTVRYLSRFIDNLITLNQFVIFNP